MIGGDPDRVPSALTLDNWQSAEYLHWAFQHVADFLPVATISRGTGPVSELPLASTALGKELSELPVSDAGTARQPTVGDTMAATATDGWLVVRHGEVLAEQYYGGMTAHTPHLLMSS